MRSLAVTLLLVLVVPLVAGAQQAPAAPTGSAQAYYEFMLGRHLESQGDETGALEALKRALAADPKSAEIRAELAAFYARQNKAEESVAAAEQALAIDPNSLEAHRILGLVFAAWSDGGVAPPAGRTRDDLRRSAIDHLTKILDTPAVATDLSLQVTLARLHMRVSQADKAIPILERIVSQAPFATEPYTMLADARVAVGRIDEAVRALQMAAELDPRRYAALGELYERLGKWAEAAEAYENGIRAVRTPSRDLRMRMIGALLNVDDRAATTRARDALKEILAGAPQDTRALYFLSAANHRLGGYAAAEDAARKLLAVDPTSVSGLSALAQVFLAQHDAKKVVELVTPFAKDAAARGKGNESEAALLLSQLGFAHLQLADPQQAIAAFTAAKRLAPKNPAFDVYIVQAHITAKQFARAAELAAEASARYPRDQRFVQLRADALASGGKLDEASKVLQELIDRDPLNASALNSLGYMLADKGVRLPEAIILIERALKIEPENPAYLDSLGWALFKTGKFEDAEPPLRKAAGALADASVIQDHFGDVLVRRGKHDEAIAAWERTLKGDGEGIDRPAVEKKIKDARARRQ
jgi:tetratricopeptide (TPR) repeat protein